MNVLRGAFCVVALLGLLGCPSKKEDDGTKPAGSSSAAATPPVASATEPKVEARPAIEARVKPEVDTRPDGITGTTLAAPGALASLQGPKEWVPAKGDPTIAGTADKKAQLAVTSFTATEGPVGKLPAVVTALGLASCEWNPPEPLTIGKTKLAGTGADGVCKRGATVVRTAYVAPTAERLLVIGAWEPDGDSAPLFGAMRSIAKAATGDSSGIAACCAALRQNARSAPPDQAGNLLMAANICDSMRSNPQGRAALAQLRAGLRGANMPAACR